MRTKVSIRGLQLYGHHGLEDAERHLGQRFLFHVECRLNDVDSHLDDRLQHSVAYDALAAEIAAVSAAKKFHTIEALAEAVARALLSSHPCIEAIDVGVAKYSPPMPYLLDAASVEISLARTEFFGSS